jgi:hypothetical protein
MQSQSKFLTKAPLILVAVMNSTSIYSRKACLNLQFDRLMNAKIELHDFAAGIYGNFGEYSSGLKSSMFPVT